MTRYRFVVASLLTAGVVALVGGAGVTQPAFAAGPCGVPRAIVIKMSPEALLVRRGKERRNYWACLRGGRAVHVGFAGLKFYAEDEYFVGQLRFGGHFFAIASDICLEGCGATDRTASRDLTPEGGRRRERRMAGSSTSAAVRPDTSELRQEGRSRWLVLVWAA
jgi:hypothetical protein